LSLEKTNLWSLKLRGNFLKNAGVYLLFKALETNKELWKIVLANNQFGESDEIPVIEQICQVLRLNSTCQWYDLDENGIYEDSTFLFEI